MRKGFRSGVLALVMPVFLSVFSSCTDMVREDLDKTHAKLQALQELAGAVNRDLTALDLIVKELDDGHTIQPESFQETEDGYEVSFRDGKKVFIPYGKDGVDGRTLIPVGVKDDADTLYWQVDGEWLLDKNGERIRAGATDGIPPRFEVRDDGWWYISVDGGKTFEPFRSCEEMDGFGVFKDVKPLGQDRYMLTMWNGETYEISSQLPFRFSFDGPVRDTVLIAAGETLPIPYKIKVEGEMDRSMTVTSGTDGVYLSSVEAVDDTTGVVTVQAPADYTDGYIVLSAQCGSYSAVKMITFRPREITPAEPFFTVRLGSGSDSRDLPYQANFEYTVNSDSWLTVVPDTESGKLTFKPQTNTGSAVRECEVTVTPKDNPDYVCTTFRVLQATDTFTAELEEGSPFTFNPTSRILSVPAAGGDATLWITYASSLSATIPETAGWIQAEISDVDGFRLLKVHVDPETAGSGRGSAIILRLQSGTVPVGDIKINQVGAASGE